MIRNVLSRWYGFPLSLHMLLQQKGAVSLQGTTDTVEHFGFERFQGRRAAATPICRFPQSFFSTSLKDSVFLSHIVAYDCYNRTTRLSAFLNRVCSMSA